MEVDIGGGRSSENSLHAIAILSPCCRQARLKISALQINTCWILLALKHSIENFHFHLNWFRVDTEFIRVTLWSILIGFVCDSGGSSQLQWTKTGKYFKYSRRYLSRPRLHWAWWVVVTLISSCCQFKERLQLACHCSAVSSLPPIKLSTINSRVSASRFSSIVSLWNMIDFFGEKKTFLHPPCRWTIKMRVATWNDETTLEPRVEC